MLHISKVTAMESVYKIPNQYHVMASPGYGVIPDYKSWLCHCLSELLWTPIFSSLTRVVVRIQWGVRVKCCLSWSLVSPQCWVAVIIVILRASNLGCQNTQPFGLKIVFVEWLLRAGHWGWAQYRPALRELTVWQGQWREKNWEMIQAWEVCCRQVQRRAHQLLHSEMLGKALHRR